MMPSMSNQQSASSGASGGSYTATTNVLQEGDWITNGAGATANTAGNTNVLLIGAGVALAALWIMRRKS